jgi:hypothetical protein
MGKLSLGISLLALLSVTVSAEDFLGRFLKSKSSSSSKRSSSSSSSSSGSGDGDDIGLIAGLTIGVMVVVIIGLIAYKKWKQVKNRAETET